VSNNALGAAVILPSIVMVGLLLIVIAWKVLDLARERARTAGIVCPSCGRQPLRRP
jgi:hypothetical protein